MQPRFWIIGGPNGSGKSTFAQHQIFERLSRTPEELAALSRINPDAVARRLRTDGLNLSEAQLALEAAQRSDREVDRLIENDQSLLVETVLSSDKMLPRIDRAIERGFWTGLIFVLLRDPALNVGRVALRVSKGGHDVPEDRIRARWLRSLERLPVFAARVSAFSVWDNSYWGEAPELLAERIGEWRYVSEACQALLEDEDTHPALAAALRAVVSGS